jgi:uncharacterized protein (TIGR00730 family)
VSRSDAGAGSGNDTVVEELIERLLDESGARRDRDLLREILAGAVELARDRASRLDLKITSAVITEMRTAFAVFAAYKGIQKVTIFGSARTAPTDRAYAQARLLAEHIAAAGWMVVTGAGPGIMAAGMEGAGAEHAIGVNIRLPFEEPNPYIATDPKLVEMRYFFTRKLMLIKESAGFAVLPGGFGTLDECFELLTLLQTGKAEPAPIVLLDTPGDSYWEGWSEFVNGEIFGRHLADKDDEAFYLITDDVDRATEEILGFYRVYHSRRFVGTTMVIRLGRDISDATLADLNEDFADICSARGIFRIAPLPAERATHDHVSLPRIALELNPSRQGGLRRLIDAINAAPMP